MSTPTRPLTPSQLAALEQAYAKAPAEGWKDLAEAYLARGRCMEAIVVAKRGARAKPDDPAPHLLLARVHATQRKPDKARAAIADALKLAPQRPDVVAAARDHGLVEADQAPTETATAPLRPGPGAAPAGRVVADPGPVSPASTDTATTAGQDGVRWTDDLARRYGDADPEDPEVRRRHARRSIVRTASLAVVLAGLLAAIWAVTVSRRARAEEQQRLVADAERLIEKDSWPAWRDAQAACEKAAALGGDDEAAHGCAAWAASVRWAEHGEGEALRAKAREHLARAGRAAERGRDAVLADAWLKLHDGDARAAADLLRARSATDAAAPLRAALGVALQQAGDGEGAREALVSAQQLAPGSPRIAGQLADLLRARGADGAQQAALLYDIVLQKLAPDHVPSLIGKARLLLDQHNPAGALAAAQRVSELKDQASPRQRARALLVASRALALEGKKTDAEAAEREARALDSSVFELRGPVAQAGR